MSQPLDSILPQNSSSSSSSAPAAQTSSVHAPSVVDLPEPLPEPLTLSPAMEFLELSNNYGSIISSSWRSVSHGGPLYGPAQAVLAFVTSLTMALGVSNRIRLLVKFIPWELTSMPTSATSIFLRWTAKKHESQARLNEETKILRFIQQTRFKQRLPLDSGEIQLLSTPLQIDFSESPTQKEKQVLSLLARYVDYLLIAATVCSNANVAPLDIATAMRLGRKYVKETERQLELARVGRCNTIDVTMYVEKFKVLASSTT